MKLTIITTIYQAEKDLPRLLDSMMAQKSKELEFFLIDNGCTDDSAGICEEYARRDSRFYIYTIKENIGYIRARNRGLDVVDSDYVGFCDSDDYLEPGAYDKIISCLKEKPCDLYIGNWNIITEDGYIRKNKLPIGSGDYNSYKEISDITPAFYGHTPQSMMMPGFMWKQVFRKKLVDQLRFKETLKPYEDMLFNASFIKKCKRIITDNDNTIYNYVVSINSITGKSQANIDIKAESRRIIELYNELKLLTTDKRCNTANANRSLFNVVTLLSLTSRTNIKNKVKEISQNLPQEYLHQIYLESKPWNFSYKILRQMIRLRMFGPILFLLKIAR